MQVDIRLLEVDHLEDYKSMRLDALKHEPTSFSGDYEEECAQDDFFHGMRLQISQVYGAYDGDAIIGMCGIILYPDKNLHHKASLWGVYVQASHRGKGISRKLITHALHELPDSVRKVTLGVETSNEAARALYDTLGFTVYGEEKSAFVKDGISYDEWLMVKFI